MPAKPPPKNTRAWGVNTTIVANLVSIPEKPEQGWPGQFLSLIFENTS